MPAKTIIVSVIIPAFNAGKTLAATIHSALAQKSENYALEIIVVNDGSTDNTTEILKAFEHSCRLLNQENKGVSAARTAGLNISIGQYVQYLDSDDLLLPGKIERQVNALQQSKADIAYGSWQKFTENEEGIEIVETIDKKITGDPVISIFSDFWCPPAAILYTRAITRKLSWKNYLPIIQDARYMLDAILQGGSPVYTPGLQALYRVQQSGSLSQRNPLAFVEDVFRNTRDLIDLWRYDLERDAEKKNALIRSLRYCLIEFSLINKDLFDQAMATILEIAPDYVPPELGLHRFLSRFLGFRNAEKIAAIKRRAFR